MRSEWVSVFLTSALLTSCPSRAVAAAVVPHCMKVPTAGDRAAHSIVRILEEVHTEEVAVEVGKTCFRAASDSMHCST